MNPEFLHPVELIDLLGVSQGHAYKIHRNIRRDLTRGKSPKLWLTIREFCEHQSLDYRHTYFMLRKEYPDEG